MSCVAIYRPDVMDFQDEPQIIQFPGTRKERSGGNHRDVLSRARLLHQNRCCPECGTAAVDPIELNDALLNAHLRPIPGTATIVAFHCNGCYHEWAAR